MKRQYSKIHKTQFIRLVLQLQKIDPDHDISHIKLVCSVLLFLTFALWKTASPVAIFLTFYLVVTQLLSILLDRKRRREICVYIVADIHRIPVISSTNEEEPVLREGGVPQHAAAVGYTFLWPREELFLVINSLIHC